MPDPIPPYTEEDDKWFEFESKIAADRGPTRNKLFRLAAGYKAERDDLQKELERPIEDLEPYKEKVRFIKSQNELLRDLTRLSEEGRTKLDEAQAALLELQVHHCSNSCDGGKIHDAVMKQVNEALGESTDAT